MTNIVYHGDCLDVLSGIPENYVNLVYLDPPFFTQKTHQLQSRDLTQYEFDDKWLGITDYIQFLRARLLAIYRVMRHDATLFFHCDHTASHHIRVLLDDIFGTHHFLSEIIWTYKRWSNGTRRLLPAHQTIFMYSKSSHYTFNTDYQPYSETTNLDQILQKRERNSHGKTTYATDETGAIVLNGSKKGVPLSDVWDIPYLNPKARERTGYPTQKPIQLLERIITLSSSENDIVLDPFCGSGTTLVTAKLLNRQFIGIDISQKAVDLSLSRLKNPHRSTSQLLKKGRQAYQNLPDTVSSILNTLPVQFVQRNSGIDAIYNDYHQGKPIVIRVQREGENILDARQKLKRAGLAKQAIIMILICTESVNQDAFWEQSDDKSVIVINALALNLQNIIDSYIAQAESLLF
ncbi:MAG TPA: site-specific DNA-methyltransferase [Aggregatilineales bacterium]|nr:site-specific DNA-methyltransferase [Aggregatilineales bacterium]